MSEPQAEAIARDAFHQIAARHPWLRIVEEPNAPVEISLSLPIQPGLKHAIWLALQNRDELHFSVGSFWMEWFPCTDASRVDKFLDAVLGFIEGRYRVVEHFRGGRCVKAKLQVPEYDRWRTIATWSHVWRFWPLSFARRSSRELRNL
jgi:hypothetical protein